jgi:pre-mRNA-splicing factor CWC26
MSASMKAYLAEKYMSGPKADAILARTTTKKKKRKPGTSASTSAASGSGAGPSGFVVDDDASWVAPPKDEEEEDDIEDAMVVKDRSFKRRKVDPSRGPIKSGGDEGGSGWTTVQEGITREGDGSPPPTADELPQIASVVEDARAAVSGGLLTKAQLRKKLGPKPSEKDKDAEEAARQQETVYRDASGRKIDMKAEKAEAARRKREAAEKEAKKMEWGKGLIQREEKERERAMMEKERHKGFSRHADDADLNEEQRAKDLWNDPAAGFLTVRPSRDCLRSQYLTTTQQKRSKGPRKPEYTGPAPPPNRFGIKPGYRWDGVDRSNGFEQKYFQRQNERKRQGAESYAWGVDDM